MAFVRSLLAALALTALMSACGGGGVDLASGGGGSGIGGTGITRVKGNVSNVDGQPAPEYTVSGGGQSVRASGNAVFSLTGVNPADSFVLRFSVEGKPEVQLNIGIVSASSTVTVTNVMINTVTGVVTSAGITVENTTDSDGTSSLSVVNSGSDDDSDDDSSDGDGSSTANQSMDDDSGQSPGDGDTESNDDDADDDSDDNSDDDSNDG